VHEDTRRQAGRGRRRRPAASNRSLEILDRIERALRWLSTWTIHNANHLREARDGLKVGGHQAPAPR